MKTVYVARPYGAPDFMGIDRNIRAAEAAAIRLWDAGFGVFCPHLNTLHFEVKSSASEEQYKLFDIRMLRACEILYLLPTWRTSSGARDECGIAIAAGLRIYADIDLLIATEREAVEPK